jgi:predicted metalloendopeptidase
VQRFLPTAAEKQLEQMVATIVAAFDRRLDGLMWMAPTTKASAKAKLAALKLGVGYPYRWRNYSKLEIVRGDAFGNAERAELFQYESALEKLAHPPNRTERWITPQTVDALNLPAQNALNFPAANLEPPLYDPAASGAGRYGAIGALIGHEISHSYGQLRRNKYREGLARQIVLSNGHALDEYRDTVRNLDGGTTRLPSGLIGACILVPRIAYGCSDHPEQRAEASGECERPGRRLDPHGHPAPGYWPSRS